VTPVTDDRLACARAVLERAGLDLEVGASGAAGEIAVLAAPLELRSVLERLAPELRACGFRYVTIELTADGSGRSGNS
jgi:hypothetical protein